MEVFRDKDKRKAFIIALLIYGGLAVLFFYIGMKYPDPPLEEGGVEISMADFGSSDAGTGTAELEKITASVPEPQPVKEELLAEDVPDVPDKTVITQEEETVAVPVEREKPVEESEVRSGEKPGEAPPAEPEPVIDEKLKNIMGAWDQPGEAQTEGTHEDATGNEGTETGKPEGMGTFGGNGSSFELGGRSMTAGPKIGEKPREEGKVVLNIWVDRQGNVVRTSENLRESNTTSQYLFNLAKKAAMDARFSTSPDAPPEQRGKMTFIFILK